MADLNIAVRLTGEDHGASGVVTGMIDAISHMGNAFKAPAQAASGFIDVLGKLGLAGMGIKTLAGAVAGVASGMVSGNAEMETYETQLGTLLGSASAAKDRLAELARFGAETPFELPEVVRAEKVLLGFGLTGKRVVEQTGKSAADFRSLVGDIAAGTGASFEEIALNMGKFSSGATGEAISRFQEMGIVTREQLQAMGVEFSKSGELLSPIPIAFQAITKISQEKFGGGMQKLSQTFSGQMSTLQDNFAAVKRTVMAPIFDVLTKSVGGLNNVLSSPAFQNALASVADWLGSRVTDGIGLATRGFTTLQDIAGHINFAAIVASASQLLSTGNDLIGFFTGAENAGLRLHNALERTFGLEASNVIIGALETIRTVAPQVIPSITKLATSIGGSLHDAFVALAPTGERLGSVFATVTDAVKGLVPEPVTQLIGSLIGAGRAATEGQRPLDVLVGAINDTSAAIATVVGYFKDHDAAMSALVGVLGAVASAYTLLAVRAAAMALVTNVVAIATGLQTAAQWALNVALTANPIGIIVVALAGLAAGLIYAYNESETFRDIVDTAFALIKKDVEGFITVMGIMATEIGKAIDFGIATFNSASATATKVFGTISTTVTEAQETVKGTMATITTAVNGAMDTIKTTTTTALNTIDTTTTTAWGTISGTYTGALATINTTINTAWAGATTATDTYLANAKKTINDVWDAIPPDIQRDLTLINNKLAYDFGQAQDKTQEWLDTTTTHISRSWDAAKTTVVTQTGLIEDDVTAKFDAAQTKIDEVMKVISDTIEGKWGEAKRTTETALGNSATGLVGTVTDGFNAISTKVRDVMGATGIQSTINSSYGAINDATNAAWNGATGSVVAFIKSGLATAEGAVASFGADVLATLTGPGGIKDQLGAAGGAIGDAIVGGVTGAIRGAGGVISSAIWDVVRAALDVVKRGLGIPTGSSTQSAQSFGIASMGLSNLQASGAYGVRRTTASAIGNPPTIDYDRLARVIRSAMPPTYNLTVAGYGPAISPDDNRRMLERMEMMRGG